MDEYLIQYINLILCNKRTKYTILTLLSLFNQCSASIIIFLYNDKKLSLAIVSLDLKISLHVSTREKFKC